MKWLTLSFDDGFKASCLKIADLFEERGLQACLNVLATGHEPDFVAPDEGQAGIAKGDFGLWRELAARGHEIMPHGFRHANKSRMPLPEAQDLIRRCLDRFAVEMPGFDPSRAVFNFPYNASTPELEAWLPSQVRAFRTGGSAFNPAPAAGLRKLTCVSFGPDSAEADLDRRVEDLLQGPPGRWLVYNLHGLDGEGWGPVGRASLERLLDRLVEVSGLRILPAGQALRGESRRSKAAAGGA